MARANPGTQTVINPDFSSVGAGYPKKHLLSTTRTRDDIPKAIQDVLGTNIKFTPATSVNLDTREGYAHSTTGIPYAISGTATVVSQKMGAWLAGFQDPIKAILGVGIHTNNKIMIKRKYVVGGSATITPERAPARTVAIKEDVREISLTRYGADIEMNLNLFLIPGDAEEELEMKMDAQKRELERKLTDLGYMCLMKEGTSIIDAIIRSNPSMSAPVDNITSERYFKNARRIYTANIFGALNKHRFPIANLLAAARYASAYSTGTQKGSVMILPHGVPDLLRYARKENMHYSVSGLKAAGKKKIDMKLEGAFEDPVSGVSILIHHPTPTYEHGVAKPNISIASGGLTDETLVISKHLCKDAFVTSERPLRAQYRWFLDHGVEGDQPDFPDITNANLALRGVGNATESKIPDVMNGGFIDASKFRINDSNRDLNAAGKAFTGTRGDRSDLTIYRVCRVVASSAILAAPGSQTGELLIGYPFTGVSTSHAEERMRIQLRCYMGAALYQPDNVLIMPNVFVEGISDVIYYTNENEDERDKPLDSAAANNYQGDGRLFDWSGLLGGNTIISAVGDDVEKTFRSLHPIFTETRRASDAGDPATFFDNGKGEDQLTAYLAYNDSDHYFPDNYKGFMMIREFEAYVHLLRVANDGTADATVVAGGGGGAGAPWTIAAVDARRLMMIARASTLLAWAKTQLNTGVDMGIFLKADWDPETNDTDIFDLIDEAKLEDAVKEAQKENERSRGPLGIRTADAIFDSNGNTLDDGAARDRIGSDWPDLTNLQTPHDGAVYVGGAEVRPNVGEFGELDHPTKYVQLHGAPQNYEGDGQGDMARV